MQIITFNTSGSQIHRDGDSRTIRIAFMLGDKVNIAGNILHDFTFCKQMADASVMLKISFVENFFMSQQIESTFSFLDFKKQNHIFNTTKNKSKQQIAAYKKFEILFFNVFNTVLKTVEESLTRSGFLELNQLFTEGDIYDSLTNIIDPESEANGKIKNSSILSLNIQPENEVNIFLLDEYFFHAPFAESYNHVDFNHNDAALNNSVVIEPLFIIPNPKFLKVAELKLIRIKLKEPRNQFNVKFDKWIKSCYENVGFEERKKIFQEELVPVAQQLSFTINGLSNIKHLETVTKMEQATEICIGEIPYQLLLDYHLHYKIISEETHAQMKILQQQEVRFNQKWPVLFYRLAFANPLDYNFCKKQNNIILPVKKSINID